MAEIVLKVGLDVGSLDSQISNIKSKLSNIKINLPKLDLEASIKNIKNIKINFDDTQLKSIVNKNYIIKAKLQLDKSELDRLKANLSVVSQAVKPQDIISKENIKAIHGTVQGLKNIEGFEVMSIQNLNQGNNVLKDTLKNIKEIEVVGNLNILNNSLQVLENTLEVNNDELNKMKNFIEEIKLLNQGLKLKIKGETNEENFNKIKKDIISNEEEIINLKRDILNLNNENKIIENEKIPIAKEQIELYKKQSEELKKTSQVVNTQINQSLMLGISVGNLISDAQFGLRGMMNNIVFIGQQIMMMKGTLGGFKAVWDMIITKSNLIFMGITAVLSALTYFWDDIENIFGELFQTEGWVNEQLKKTSEELGNILSISKEFTAMKLTEPFNDLLIIAKQTEISILRFSKLPKLEKVFSIGDVVISKVRGVIKDFDVLVEELDKIEKLSKGAKGIGDIIAFNKMSKEELREELKAQSALFEPYFKEIEAGFKAHEDFLLKYQGSVSYITSRLKTDTKMDEKSIHFRAEMYKRLNREVLGTKDVFKTFDENVKKTITDTRAEMDKALTDVANNALNEALKIYEETLAYVEKNEKLELAKIKWLKDKIKEVKLLKTGKDAPKEDTLIDTATEKIEDFKKSIAGIDFKIPEIEKYIEELEKLKKKYSDNELVLETIQVEINKYNKMLGNYSVYDEYIEKQKKTKKEYEELDSKLKLLKVDSEEYNQLLKFEVENYGDLVDIMKKFKNSQLDTKKMKEDFEKTNVELAKLTKGSKEYNELLKFRADNFGEFLPIMEKYSANQEELKKKQDEFNVLYDEWVGLGKNATDEGKKLFTFMEQGYSDVANAIFQNEIAMKNFNEEYARIKGINYSDLLGQLETFLNRGAEKNNELFRQLKEQEHLFKGLKEDQEVLLKFKFVKQDGTVLEEEQTFTYKQYVELMLKAPDAKQVQDTIGELLNQISNALSEVGNIFGAIFDKESMLLQNRLDDLAYAHEVRMGFIDEELEAVASAGFQESAYYKETIKKKQKIEKDFAAEERKLQSEMWEVNKKAQLTQAYISGAQAQLNIWASTPMVDFGIMRAILSALAATASVLQISNINSQRNPYNRKQFGGFIDSVPASLTPGEFVVNRESARRNKGLLENLNNGSTSGGRESVININISGDVIGSTSFVEDVLIPKIQQGLKKGYSLAV